MRWVWVPALILGFVAIAGAASGAVAPQDDASSGQDAPDEPNDTVEIASGEVYQGTLEGYPTDTSDHYAFHAAKGDRIDVRADGPLGCYYVKAPNGTQLGFSCTVGYTELTSLTVTANSTGTHYLEYSYLEAQAYAFGLGVNEDAPAPLPTSGLLLNPDRGLPEVASASESDPHTVVAVIDTGINPYHDFFAAPNLDDHPSTWLDGFPSEADTVDLSLDAGSYDEAVDQDQDRLKALERSAYHADSKTFDDHVYTFPGTRVVAGVSFGEYAATGGEAGDTPILDEDGHGTGSAALAAGASLAEADGDVLVVAVEVGAGDFDAGLYWAAQQPWIDAMSVSLGTVANVPYPSEPLGFGPDVEGAMRLAEEAGKPVYVASGNGFSSTGVGPDHCTTYTSGYTGPPSVTRIGAAEPQSENPSTWHCVPVDAIAATPVPSAAHDSIEGTEGHSGTSAATPNAMGHWAELNQRAREQGLDVTRTHVSEQLLREARPAETDVAVGAEPSTEATAPLDQGYGVVNGDALDRAWTRLESGQAPAERPRADAFFEQDRRIRELLWGEGGALTGDRVDDLFSSGSLSADQAAGPDVEPAVDEPIRTPQDVVDLTPVDTLTPTVSP